MTITVICLFLWCVILSAVVRAQAEDIKRIDAWIDTQCNLWEQQNRFDEQVVRDIEQLEDRQQKEGA